MRADIDWDSVFASLPELMGLSGLKLRGKIWVGPYRIDGTPHHRWDKLAIKQGGKDKMPLILEQGGESMTLWSWFAKYGRLSNGEIRAILTGTERRELVFKDEEYMGPVRSVEPWRFIEEGGMDGKWSCPLFSFLMNFWDKGKVVSTFKKYNVSTGLKHTITGIFGTRFWYINQKRQILHDKTMFYGPDGHRMKECPPMRRYKKRYGYRGECLFGEDSLIEGRPIFVVESEKTAIICHLEYPEYNWVATGGMNNVQAVKSLDVTEEIWLVPDRDGVEQWSKYGKIWRWWERCGLTVGEKWDIGDFILAKKVKNQQML
jgi:hypothetical protein